MVEDWTDDEIWSLSRGGHDYRKMYAAYRGHRAPWGQPTVILAKTIKGWTLAATSRAATRPPDEEADPDDITSSATGSRSPSPTRTWTPYLPPYYHPSGPDHEHTRYMPSAGPPRRRWCPRGAPPPRRSCCRATPSTTWSSAARASSRSPRRWRSCACSRTSCVTRGRPAHRADHPGRGPHLRHGLDVPDGEDLLAARPDLHLGRPRPGAGLQESTSGQILQEGINEAGSVASFTAAGRRTRPTASRWSRSTSSTRCSGSSARATPSGRPWTRWRAAFVLGATAGRTTLNGEGLQHEDGPPPVLAATNPAVVGVRPGVRLRARAISCATVCAGCTATSPRTSSTT